MRTFIAIELPKETKDTLAKLQERLKAAGADVKWVKPDHIHLTLKFLGEVNDKKLDKIKSVLADVAKENPAFQIEINSAGAFPNLSSPRVIWVGADKGDNETKKIAAELEEKIAREAGIPKEKRPFSSHITLGRVRSNTNREKLTQEIQKIGDTSPIFSVSKIILFKSTLTPNGPIYEALKEASLKTT